MKETIDKIRAINTPPEPLAVYDKMAALTIRSGDLTKLLDALEIYEAMGNDTRSVYEQAYEIAEESPHKVDWDREAEIMDGILKEAQDDVKAIFEPPEEKG